MLISEAFAQAAAPAQSEGGSLMSLLPLIGIFVIFYLLLIRPQSRRAKEHKQMVEGLQRGDEIITSGGELGLILNVSDSYVIVEIAGIVDAIQFGLMVGARIVMQRGLIVDNLVDGYLVQETLIDGEQRQRHFGDR